MLSETVGLLYKCTYQRSKCECLCRADGENVCVNKIYHIKVDLRCIQWYQIYWENSPVTYPTDLLDWWFWDEKMFSLLLFVVVVFDLQQMKIEINLKCMEPLQMTTLLWNAIRLSFLPSTHNSSSSKQNGKKWNSVRCSQLSTMASVCYVNRSAQNFAISVEFQKAFHCRCCSCCCWCYLFAIATSSAFRMQFSVGEYKCVCGRRREV